MFMDWNEMNILQLLTVAEDLKRGAFDLKQEDTAGPSFFNFSYLLGGGPST